MISCIVSKSFKLSLLHAEWHAYSVPSSLSTVWIWVFFFNSSVLQVLKHPPNPTTYLIPRIKLWNESFLYQPLYARPASLCSSSLSVPMISYPSPSKSPLYQQGPSGQQLSYVRMTTDNIMVTPVFGGKTNLGGLWKCRSLNFWFREFWHQISILTSTLGDFKTAGPTLRKSGFPPSRGTCA